jgi:hypothetical protein
MKVLRWIGVALLASSVLMATLVAIAPTLLSTSWCQGLCLKAASHVYPGSIELESLSVGWLSGVDVHNLKVKDPQGRDLFSCTQFSLDRPLISLVFSRKDFGSVKVVSPLMYCYASENTFSSTKEELRQHKKEKQDNQPFPPEKNFKPSQGPALPSATPDIKGHITISDAKLITLVDDKVVGSLSQGEVTLDLDLLHTSNGKFEAALSQGFTKQTPLSLTFTVHGAPQLAHVKGSFSLSCNKVPTEVLAALAHSLHPDISDFLRESFGSSVSYSLSATMDGPAIVLHSALLSDNLQSDIHMKVDDDVVTVDKGSLFAGTVSPRLFNLIIKQATPTRDHDITLLSPTSCSLENKQPLSFRLSELALVSPLDIQCSTKNPFSLSIGANKSPINISVNTTLHGNPSHPSASIDVTAASAMDTATFLFTASGSKKDAGYQVLSAIDIKGKWPTIAETITGFPATTLLGQELTGSVKAEGQILSVDDFSLQGESHLSSQNLQKNAVFSCTNTIFSVSQASFDAKIPTSLVEKYGATPHFPNSVDAVHIQSTVNKFSLPLDHFIPVTPKAVIDATATIEIPTIALQPHEGLNCSLGSSEIAITKNEKSPTANFSVQATVPVTSKTQPLITTLIGSSGLHLTMVGKYDFDRSMVTVNTADVLASRLSASVRDMHCSFGNGIEVGLSSSATARLLADKDMIESLSSSSLPCTLAGPTELSVTMKPFTVSRKNGTWQGSQLFAELQGKDICIAGKQSFGPYSLSIPISVDINRQTLIAEPTITSNTTRLLKGSSTVTIGENAELPVTERVSVDCSVEISHLPTAILELFSHRPLIPIIGDDLSSTISCNFHGLSAKGNSFSLSSSGAFGKANLAFALDAMHLSAGGVSAVDIEATVSPKSFEALKSLFGMKSDVSIGDAVTVHLTVPQCAADLSPFVSQDKKQGSLWQALDTVSFSAKTSFSAMQLLQKGASIGCLSPLKTTCDLQGNSHSLHFAVNTSDGAVSDAMTIAMKGSFANIWNNDGLCLPSSHLRSTIDIDRFPTSLLDLALPQQGALLEEAIGKTIRIVGDFSADEMKSGTVKLDLQSTNCSLHLDGSIDNGMLRLKNPAQASLSITKQAGALLLKNVNPLLATAAHSEKPIQLTIGSEGAAIPISPFSMTGVCLPKVTANVGKIVVKNGGALKIILALLNMGQAANSDDLDVWLTPIYMRVQGGVVTCQRADALVANKIHMITWGEVSLAHNTINMVVAIPQETLAALRLRIISPTPERGLQIPITGSSSNPKIDTTRATARLAGAAIVDNVPDPRLQIFGGLLQAAAAVTGEPDQPIPPQTTCPFPWEK